MKHITETDAFGELASARDGLGEISSQLYLFSRKAAGDESSEGMLLALAVRNVQLQLNDLQKQLADLTGCYH